MIEGQLIINGKDAFKTWGVFLTSKALNAFRKRGNNKAIVRNSSRKEHGERVVFGKTYKDARDIIAEFNIACSSRKDFREKYENFMDELDGEIKIYIRDTDRNYFVYVDDHMDLEFFNTIGNISIKFREPNPTRR